MAQVLGFMFSPEKGRVVLIKKTHPPTQNEKYNGVGGKSRGDESPMDAMMRKFLEETTVKTVYDDWSFFHKLQVRGGGVVHCFRCFSSGFINVQTTGGAEEVIVCDICQVNSLPLVTHLDWLIPLALNSIVVASYSSEL